MRYQIALFTVWLLASHAWAGGFASNEDFVVRIAGENGQSMDRYFAEEVALKASQYKNLIATEWLGKPLPRGIGRTYLTVMVTDRGNNGRTWPKNEITGEYHNVHLRTTKQGALGGTLAHEIAHVVLSTRYQGASELPPWAAEGIASRYDESSRVAQRIEILAWYRQTDNWPELRTIMEYDVIPAADKASYAVSVSLCEFLLTRGDKSRLLSFAVDGAQKNWDQALLKAYQIRDVQELQLLWETWAGRRLTIDASPSDAQ